MDVAPRLAGLAIAQSNTAQALIQLGEWTKAARLIAEALERPLRGLPLATLCCNRADLAIWQGRFEEAELALQMARDAPTGELPLDWRYAYDARAAEFALWQGQPEDAVHAATATSSIPGADPSLLERLRLAAAEMRALADAAGRAQGRSASIARERLRERGNEIEEEIHVHVAPLPELAPEWKDFWLCSAQFGEQPAVHDVRPDSIEKWLHLIQRGQGIDTCPAYVARY